MNNFSNVKLNGEEISMMKLNGTIIYQKGIIPEPEPELPIVAKYTLSDISKTSPTYVLGKPSDWTETIKDNNDGTYTVTITASRSVGTIRFNGMTSLISMDYLDVSRVRYFSLMFEGCTNLTYVNTSNWSGEVWGMENMFKNCASLTSLDLSGLETYSNESVGMFDSAFYGCSDLEILNISNFSLNYYNIEEGYMAQDTFDGCTSLHTIRMDNCNYWFMNEISLPDNTISGVTKTVYCRESNIIHPESGYRRYFPSWTFSFIE
jgi:surface protein